MEKGVTERDIVRVLVVDDDEIIARTVAMILGLHGFESKFRTNPNDALESARVEAPHLLISDVAMPQMTGIELAIRVNQICPSCKVLLLSGHAITQEPLRAARTKGHEFRLLHKPIHPLKLLAAVRGTARAEI